MSATPITRAGHMGVQKIEAWATLCFFMSSVVDYFEVYFRIKIKYAIFMKGLIITKI